MGSIRASWATTAILARLPASRAQLLISSSPCSISGTSLRNNSTMNSGAERESSTEAPRKVESTSMIMARTRSPVRKFSFGIISLRRKRPSIRPLSTIRSPLSRRLTVPLKIFSPRSRKSRSSISRSASRMRCNTTCLAVIAPIRPIETEGTCSSMYSPSATSATRSCASMSSSSASGFCNPASLGTTSQRRNVSYSPVSRSMATRISTSPGYCFLVACASACSTALNTTSRSTFFSRAMASTSMSISRFILSNSIHKWFALLERKYITAIQRPRRPCCAL